MKAIAFPIFVLVAVVSIVAPFWVKNRSQARLASLENTINDQAKEIARFSEAKPPSSPPVQNVPQLSNEEMRELMRLRSEVGRLHDVAAETARLRAAQNGVVTSSVARSPEPAGPNFWPLDHLANMGFGTPEAAAQTAFWSLKNGDMKALLACAPPEAMGQLQHEMEKDGKSLAAFQDEFKTKAQDMTGNASGYRLLDQKSDNAGQVILKIGFEGEGVTEDVTLKQYGTDWKIVSFGNPTLITDK